MRILCEGRDEVSIGAQVGVFGGVRLIAELAMGARFQAVLYDPGSSTSAIGFLGGLNF